MPAPVLVIGLGNPLAGDDGVGWHVVEELERRHLPPEIELIRGGTDLLALQLQIEGRRHVILVDALLGPGNVGDLFVTDNADELDDRQGGAHQLSAVQALALMRAVVPAVRTTRVTWIAVEIGVVTPGAMLSPELRAALPVIADRVCSTCRSVAPRGSTPDASASERPGTRVRPPFPH
jgi:hydrogenase maturation protease